MICPACGADLAHRDSVGAAFDECTRCHGIWLDTASFIGVVESLERQESVLRKLRQYAAEPQPPNHASPLPCPRCGRGMHRHEYAAASGIHVDTCREHGIWFDHDELRRIVEFVRAGGLKHRRDRHGEQSDDRQRGESAWPDAWDLFDLILDFVIYR